MEKRETSQRPPESRDIIPDLIYCEHAKGQISQTTFKAIVTHCDISGRGEDKSGGVLIWGDASVGREFS